MFGLQDMLNMAITIERSLPFVFLRKTNDVDEGLQVSEQEKSSRKLIILLFRLIWWRSVDNQKKKSKRKEKLKFLYCSLLRNVLGSQRCAILHPQRRAYRAQYINSYDSWGCLNVIDISFARGRKDSALGGENSFSYQGN